MFDSCSVSLETMKTLNTTLQNIIVYSLIGLDYDSLVSVIVLFEDDIPCDVDVTSPISLEDYQNNGYIEQYYTVGEILSRLTHS